ncbi:MAG: hypothetical protein EZS28_010207, partial [Streblomastix strix]
MHKWMLKGFVLIPVGKDDEGHYWPEFGPGVPHATDRRKTKQQGQTPSMDDVRALWKKHNFDLRVACARRDYDSKDDSKTLQSSKTTRRQFRNKFGRNKKDLYHHITRDRDMTLLTEAENQEKDQDQEVIQGLENSRVQEKLQTKVIMDLRLGMNKEVEVGEHIEEGGTIIQERVQIIKIEINLTRIGTEKHRNIIHIQNRPLTRQRIPQTGT